MFKMLMFTFGSVILQTANVPNRFIKGCFSGIVTSKKVLINKFQ